MQKRGIHIILGFTLLFGSLLIYGCDQQVTQESGTLEGVVSIGPICPVETDPPEPRCLPTAETYKAYPVGVWTLDGKKKVVAINPALDGSFSTELAPGIYLVIHEKSQNSIGSSTLPAEVTITSKGKTILNINIDTGIR